MVASAPSLTVGLYKCCCDCDPTHGAMVGLYRLGGGSLSSVMALGLEEDASVVKEGATGRTERPWLTSCSCC